MQLSVYRYIYHGMPINKIKSKCSTSMVNFSFSSRNIFIHDYILSFSLMSDSGLEYPSVHGFICIFFLFIMHTVSSNIKFKKIIFIYLFATVRNRKYWWKLTFSFKRFETV